MKVTFLQFDFPMIPVPKQSFRITRRGHRYQSSNVVQAERSISIMARKQIPKCFEIWTGPVRVEKLSFVFLPPASFSKAKKQAIRSMPGVYAKTTKPDTDNLEKLLWDSLEGLLFKNDAQIFDKRKVSKVYGIKPGIQLEIREVKDMAL